MYEQKIILRLLCHNENSKNVTMTIYANIKNGDMTGIFVLIVLRTLEMYLLSALYLPFYNFSLPCHPIDLMGGHKIGWGIKCRTKTSCVSVYVMMAPSLFPFNKTYFQN